MSTESKEGRIELILGPMFSGKSTRLIEIIRKYVYKAQLTGAQNEPTEFPVLTADTKGNTLIVSDQLPRGTAAYLDFYAYICQVVEDDAATDFEILRAADDMGNGSGNGGN